LLALPHGSSVKKYYTHLPEDSILENLHKNKFAAVGLITFFMVAGRQINVYFFGGEYNIVRDIAFYSMMNIIIVFFVLSKEV
jgi:hypothetical protein